MLESLGQNAGRSFSLRSVLLIMLIVGFGVGLAVYTLGNAFAAVASLARGSTLQGTTTGTTTTSVAHNCTRTSG